MDTTFARINMGEIACKRLEKANIAYKRSTVPGIKDLAVECERLLEECDIAIALGMVGGADVDEQCALEASLGIQMAKIKTGKHIIEVFIHEREAWSERELKEICINRVEKHVDNVIWLLTHREELIKRAGKGIRQGKPDEGPLEEEEWIGIVVSRFNENITTKMKERALELLKGKKVVVREVPGSYDMPLMVKKLLMCKKIKGVVALGAVVKGGTAHDEIVAKSTSYALTRLSLQFNKPVTLGIIGYNASWSDALQRGEEYAERAVKALLELVEALKDDVC